ncbi:GNAT family N-acetyltransferase [Massilia sp. S19_KUP03_FR1]|uniref:GNAT family N-acetyltransferase n=1 Tax=Massilia sp. S19_KUP03_FR1 TaxID=3025503 RepID=UPI002FCD0810
MPTTIETRQLLLRPFTLDDAPDYWPLAKLPDVLRYTGEDARTSLEEVREVLLTRPLRDYAVHGYGRMACIEKSTGRLVGFSGLKYLEDLQETDIGYRFLPDSWGKGYATESAQALMAHGREQFGLTRIIGLVQPANGASSRVLEKLGLVYERSFDPDDGHGILKVYATPA